jgi:amino acid adenylation domain-containing protein
MEPMVMNETTVDFHFERQVSRTPDALALVGSGERLSYRDLNDRANRLGRLLAGRGVRRGDVVLLSLPRSVEAIVAMIAIMKIGAVFGPIDPAYPAPVKQQLVLDSGARHAVVGRRGDAALSEAGVDCIDVSDPAGFGGPAGDPAERTHDGEAPLYIMFTSGSTGKPKGVVVPHRGVVRLALDTNYIQVDPADVVLQLSPITFDASTFEIWGALLNGARLVVHEAPGFDPNAVARLVADEKVTVMWLTAALFHLVVRSFIGLLSGLRVLLAGGDVLNPAAVREVLKTVPGIVVINGYGPTENTTFTCCHVMTAATPPGETVPIGRPITGTDAYILDADRREVGIGEAGELYAGGAGVALGYLNAPETTARSFVADPSVGPGTLYRTGDLVRRRSDGVIEFLGRIDSVVKIRGFRVSTDEVRSLLIKLPGIDDAVVQVSADAAGEKQLAAVVQARETRPDMVAFIRKELRKQVPIFMVPDSITVCEELPVSANGKIDRKKFQQKTLVEGEKHA